MPRLPHTLLLVLSFAAASVHAVGLPDTGQDACYSNIVVDGVVASNTTSIARDAGSHPRQDCLYGRDAATAASALTKTGAGAKGFDYSKIANDGSVLAAGATLGTNSTDWACTKDNITGLTWEVKTASGLRNNASTYTWYSSNAASNGGIVGTANGGTCSGGTGCDTEKFVANVNTASLCSYTDWRMPTQRELLTLVYADGSSPSIDPTYFPNTPTSHFWSGSSYVSDPIFAWYVYFVYGSSGTFKKKGDYYSGVVHRTDGIHVRLVRGGQF